MRKFFLVLISFYSLNFFAQDSIDSIIRIERTKYHYVNIQANLLLQQFLNFNNAIVNSNPYMFNYSFTDKRTGNGFVLGTGLSAGNDFSNDGVVEITKDNISIAFRAGYEKKFYQKEKFIPFFGLELGVGFSQENTKSRLVQTINNPETEIEATKLFFGPAARGGIYYAVSKRFLLGTEFYFNFQFSQNRTITKITGMNIIKRTSIPVNFGIQAPTALFLAYRF